MQKNEVGKENLLEQTGGTWGRCIGREGEIIGRKYYAEKAL